MAYLGARRFPGGSPATHMKNDTDLDALSEREDFKKLIAELEKGGGRKVGGKTRSHK